MHQRQICTLTAYGYMSELCLQAVQKLAFEHEIFCRLVIPTRLSPFGTTLLQESVQETGSLVIVEEGTMTLGWGAEVAARIAGIRDSGLKQLSRVAARDTPVPAAPTLEAITLPQVESIVNTVRKMAGKNG